MFIHMRKIQIKSYNHKLSEKTTVEWYPTKNEKKKEIKKYN